MNSFATNVGKFTTQSTFRRQKMHLNGKNLHLIECVGSLYENRKFILANDL